MQRRMEIYYALVLAQLLGHVSKKLPKLEHLPILDNAPDNTKEYIAEATRCYLLKLNRACISLCRACLEDTLKSVLTKSMENELKQEVQRNGSPMVSLIAVCTRHGVLKNHEDDAHYIREAGNQILHLNVKKETDADLAGDVLWKTRKIIGLIHGGLKKNS